MAVESNKINIFPSAARDVNYIQDKILSEQTIVNTVKNLSPDGTGSFIISDSFGDLIEFYISGYYIRLNTSVIDLTNTGSVWATLNFNTSSELYGDSNNNYDGLSIVYEDPGSNVESLLLGEIINGQFILNELKKLSNLVDISVYFIDVAVTGTDVPASHSNSTNKLWVDITQSDAPILRYYNGESWIKLGAVYK